MQPFAHRQFKTGMLIERGIKPQSIASATVNTYDAGEVNSSIDSWNGGKIIPKRVLVLVDVASITAGTLTVSLRDSATDDSGADGDTNSGLVCQLTDITAAGLYFAEINLAHVFPNTTDAQSYIRRYHSIRAVTAGGTAVVGVSLIYSFMDGKIPTQSCTELSVAFNDPS